MTLAFITYNPLVKIHFGTLRHLAARCVGIAVGFLAGARLLLPESRRRGIPDEQCRALLTRAAIGAIVGARAAYVVNHLGEYSKPRLVRGVARRHLTTGWDLRRDAVRLSADAPLQHSVPLDRMRPRPASRWASSSDASVISSSATTSASPPTSSWAFGATVPTAHHPASRRSDTRFINPRVRLHLRLAAATDALAAPTAATPRGFPHRLLRGVVQHRRIIEDFFRIDVTHGTGLTGSQWAPWPPCWVHRLPDPRHTASPPVGEPPQQRPKLSYSKAGTR